MVSGKQPNRVARKLAAFGTAAALVLGGAVVAAPAANAGTASSCQVLDAGYGRQLGTTGYRYASYCYVDYDWSEEVFFGMHDGWKITQYSNNKCSLAPWLGYRPAGC